jgi:hypothetical protein
MTEVSALLDEHKRRLGSQYLESATMKAHVMRKDLTVAVGGASRGIGFRIDKEMTVGTKHRGVLDLILISMAVE